MVPVHSHVSSIVKTKPVREEIGKYLLEFEMGYSVANFNMRLLLKVLKMHIVKKNQCINFRILKCHLKELTRRESGRRGERGRVTGLLPVTGSCFRCLYQPELSWTEAWCQKLCPDLPSGFRDPSTTVTIWYHPGMARRRLD